jgi:hypothetical protein
MEKSAVLAPVPKQKASIVEREGPGWAVWLDSQGDGDCPICGTGPNSRHGSYVRPLRDLPAQGTSILIQATRRVAGSPRAPRFTRHKMGCGAIGMPRRASARVPHRVKESPITVSATLAVAREQSALALELRSATALARLLLESGQRDEARQTLAVVCDRFTEGFETADLRFARRLIKDAEAAPRIAP